MTNQHDHNTPQPALEQPPIADSLATSDTLVEAGVIEIVRPPRRSFMADAVLVVGGKRKPLPYDLEGYDDDEQQEAGR